MMVAPVLLGLPFTGPAMAGPEGGQVSAGDASIAVQGSTTTVTQRSSHAVIDWQNFSIGKGELAQFVMPGADSAVLNRVVSSIPSEILGQLRANGRVYLINPNGIVIGEGAVIDTAGFVASTLDVATPDFMAGGEDRFVGTSTASVINVGEIRARNGDVYLVAHRVDNRGTITAHQGEAGLVAAQDVVIARNGDDRIAVRVSVDPTAVPDGTGVSNSGVIDAAQARLEAANGNAYALAINNTGRVRATGIERGPDGRILLTGRGGTVRAGGSLVARQSDGAGGHIVVDAGTGGEVTVDGQLDAAGTAGAGSRGGRVDVLGGKVTLSSDGRIDVSGDAGGGIVRVGGGARGGEGLLRAQETEIENGAVIAASARIDGDGGDVVVWSDSVTLFRGGIEALGGTAGGDGGTVEVSSAYQLTYQGLVDLRAEAGDFGSLLIDPTDFYIDAGATGANRWNNTDLGNQLDLADVTVATAAAGGQPGDIYVNANVSWSADTTLTLQAANDINVNADLINTGSGHVDMAAGADINIGAAAALSWNAPTGKNIPNPPNVNSTWTAGGNVAFDGDITAVAGGTLTVNAGGDITVGATADLHLRHDYDPVGAGTSATRYHDLTMIAGGNVSVGGKINNAGLVTFRANGGNVTLAADMTNPGSDSGVSYLDVDATGDIDVTGDIYGYGGADSRFNAGGDITVDADINVDRHQIWVTGAGRTMTVDNGQLRVRNGNRDVDITAGQIVVGANGNLRAGGDVRMRADDIDISTSGGQKVTLDRSDRYVVIENRNGGGTICLGTGACGGANQLTLTTAELNQIDTNNYTQFGNGNTDLIHVDGAVDLSNRLTHFRSDDLQLDAAVTSALLRLYNLSGGQVNVGTDVAGQYSVDAAELDLLGANGQIGTLEFRSENQDIIVDSPRSGVNALIPGTNHLSFYAGTGDVVFKNGTIVSNYNLTVDAATIDIQAGADIKAGADTGLGDAANRSGDVSLYADDGITVSADITSGDNADIVLNADRDQDGIGSLIMDNSSKVTLAPTHSGQINDVTVQVASLSDFKTTGADGFYLNFGGINVLPTIGSKVLAIGGNAAADLACYNAGNVCDLADPTHTGNGVFHVQEGEHLDKFYDPGRARFGSDDTEVLVLGDYDYRLLVAGTGNDRSLQLIGNEIRFDHEYAAGNPTGAFAGSLADFANPDYYDLGAGVDVHISPASGGYDASGSSIAATVDAYYGVSAGAPSYGTAVAGATTGHVISNEFINVWSGNQLLLGTAIDPNNGNYARYADNTTVNGLDTFTAGRFGGQVTIRGNSVLLTGADTVVDQDLRIDSVSSFREDAVVIDAKAISKNRGITVEAWDNLNNGQDSYRRGGTISITANGSLVTESTTSGAADVFLRGRAFKIDSGASLAIDSRRDVVLETYDYQQVTNITLGAGGASAGNDSYIGNDQLARIQVREGGLTLRGNGHNRNDNARTRTNFVVDGVDETAFANVRDDISVTAVSYINNNDGNGTVTFSGAASDLGDGSFYFGGQAGVNVNTDVSAAPGAGLHIESGYLAATRQYNRTEGIRGTGTIEATHLRLDSLAAGIGTAANPINTKATNLWLTNAADEYDNHTNLQNGGIYVANVSADGLSLNKAHNLGGTGEAGGSDIVVTQTGGGALYVMNDAGDYGADNPWGLATDGVLVQPDRYRINGPTRYPYGQPGDVTLTSDGGIVVLNRIEIDDPATTGTNPGLTGAPVQVVDTTYDAFTDNVHLINAETGSGLITIDNRPAGGDPAAYVTPTVTLDGGNSLKLDRAMALGAGEYFRVDGGAALADVTITAPITSAATATATRASIDIRADQSITLGANADITVTAASGRASLQAANGAIAMADDHTVGTAVTAPDPGVLPAGATAVAAGTAVRSRSGSLVTAAAGQELNQPLRLTAGTDLKAETVLTEGSVLGEAMVLRRADGSTATIAAGTTLAEDYALTTDMILTADTTLTAGSIVADGTVVQGTMLAATGASGSIEVMAGTDVALGQIDTVNGDITVRAGLGGVTGTVTDATLAEMADADDDTFNLGGQTDTDHANLRTANGTVHLYGKGIGTNSATGEGFIDFHSTANGGLSIVDPTDATLAGAYGTDAGDGAFVSLLGNFPAGGGTVTIDVKAQAGVGIAATGNLDWTGAGGIQSLGGGDIGLIARGITDVGDLTFSGALDATNTATGTTGNVVLRARRDIISLAGTARVTGNKLIAVSETSSVGTAANPLLTEMNEIEFSAQTGTYITDIGVDPTLAAGKTVTMRTLPLADAPATNGAITIRARENIAFDTIETASGDVTVEAGYNNGSGTLVAGEGSILNGGAGSIVTGAGDVTLNAGKNVGDAADFLVVDVSGAGALKVNTKGSDLAAGDGAYIGFAGDFTLSTSPVQVNSAGSVGIKATENLNWDAAGNISSAVGGDITLIAEGQTTPGDVTISKNITTTGGNLVLQAKNDAVVTATSTVNTGTAATRITAGNAARVDAGSLIQSGEVVADADGIDLITQTDELTLSVGAAGARVTETDTVILSGGAKGGSGGGIDVTAGGTLTVGLTQAATKAGATRGHVLSDGAGQVTLTATAGDISLDGTVGSATGGVAGVAHQSPTALGTGAVILNAAAGAVTDASMAEIAAGEDHTSAGLNVATGGTATFNAITAGVDADADINTGISDSLDVRAGTVTATTTGTTAGQGVHLRVQGDFATGQAAGMTSGRDLTIGTVAADNGAGDITVDTALTAGPGGVLHLNAGNDLTINAGANVTGTDVVALHAANNATMAGGTVQATGTGVAWLQGQTKTEMTGGTLTSTGTGASRTFNTGAGNAMLDAGVVVSGGEVLLTGAAPTTGAAGIGIVGAGDVTLTGAAVATGGGDLVVVVDQAGGGGGLSLDAGSSLSAGGAPVQLFLVDPVSNEIDGLVGGATFVEGDPKTSEPPIYNWGHTFGMPILTPTVSPYTVFYKLPATPDGGELDDDSLDSALLPDALEFSLPGSDTTLGTDYQIEYSDSCLSSLSGGGAMTSQQLCGSKVSRRNEPTQGVGNPEIAARTDSTVPAGDF